MSICGEIRLAGRAYPSSLMAAPFETPYFHVRRDVASPIRSAGSGRHNASLKMRNTEEEISIIRGAIHGSWLHRCFMFRLLYVRYKPVPSTCREPVFLERLR